MKLQALTALLALAIFGGALITYPAADAPRSTEGHAKYYSPGVFRRVAAVRRIPLRQDVNGYASVPDCRWIGRIVHARIAGSATEAFQVLDCSHPRDRPRHLRQHLVIEVDHATARRHGFVTEGRAPATVYYPLP